jgi:excisionase family DNA binding protein
MAVDDRAYYNISEAAALLGVSRVSIWRWVRDGRLPVTRLGHRTTRIKREDLEQVLREATVVDTRRSDGPRPTERVDVAFRDVNWYAPDALWASMGASEHFVQFYDDDAYLLDAVGEFIGAGLNVGDAGIVIATPAHRAALAERLQAAGLDVGAASDQGAYVALDAAETLARFMVDGAPHPERFIEVCGRCIARAAEGGRHVRVFGEMVALLALDGQHAATIQLEELWNDLQQTQSFALFCAYPMHDLGSEILAELIGDVCDAHSRVIPAESYTALPSADERLRQIALLQQKARWLEAEIAERERAQEQLQSALAAERAARQEAEAALRVRDEFLSIAAHELKTPLTGLAGHAHLVLRQLKRDGQIEPERVAQALEAITNQTDKLSRLLNQLLDVSRLESGKLSVEPQPTDLTNLIEQAVATARASSDRHLITVVAPDALIAYVDPLRLDQILTNLLDNAIKFSPDGGPIDVALTQLGEAVAELAVRDRGLGIPPEKREQIFERFYQAHRNGHKSGLGLGLYVSRQIVELHGGEIDVEFPPDGGARFVVRLPIDVDVPTAVAAGL